jgi:hypothetical protein
MEENKFPIVPRVTIRDEHIRAHYDQVKRRWYAKLGKEQHPIAQVSLEIAGVKTLFSLPENTKHDPWTERTVTKIENPFEVSKWWAVLREGIAITGKPNLKDGTYIINRILYDNVKEEK